MNSIDKTNIKKTNIIIEDNDLKIIKIDEFCKKLDTLGKESNKKEFIKNYNDYKQKINCIDNYLNDNSNNYENLSLQELFILLENNTINDDMSIIELKNYINIIEIIKKNTSTACEITQINDNNN